MRVGACLRTSWIAEINSLEAISAFIASSAKVLRDCLSAQPCGSPRPKKNGGSAGRWLHGIDGVLRVSRQIGFLLRFFPVDARTVYLNDRVGYASGFTKIADRFSACRNDIMIINDDISSYG